MIGIPLIDSMLFYVWNIFHLKIHCLFNKYICTYFFTIQTILLRKKFISISLITFLILRSIYPSINCCLITSFDNVSRRSIEKAKICSKQSSVWKLTEFFNWINSVNLIIQRIISGFLTFNCKKLNLFYKL